MKAAVCYEFGQPLVIEDVALDPPEEGEVQVRLAACAVCHSDIHYAEGAWGGTLPAVYGHEAAGIVEAIGSGVEHVAVGGHVIVSLLRSCGRCFFCRRGDPQLCAAHFALDRENRLRKVEGTALHQGLRSGAFAEAVVVHASQVVSIPATLALDRASLLACGVITGLGAVVNSAQVPAGASVVVIGAGGVGLNAVQGALLSGADPLIAVDLVDAKLAAAEDFGASHTINPEGEDLSGAVRELTGGRGADFVFVAVGSVRAIEQGLALLRAGGTLIVVGMPALGQRANIDVLALADAGQRIVGSKMGSTRLATDIPKLVALYEQGRLKLDEPITKRYPLMEINADIAAVKQGEALPNVIVF